MLKRMYDLQKKKGKKGFSMIELIIVLAIMAILVALIGTQLIPYLEKSRQKRDQTTLDTCKTAYESVVADYELTISDGDQSIFADADQLADFCKYSGLSSTDTPFKSQLAGTSSTISSIKFVYSGGKITDVQVGNLSLVSGDITP